MKFLRLCLLLALITMGANSVSTNAEAVTHLGERYVINVEEMDLDGDESLMDIIMMAPEFLSLDGKVTLGNYEVRIDNVYLGLDEEAFLYNTKAREVKEVSICTFTSVSKGNDGVGGVIDVIYRNSVAQNKVALSGSTYGNGQLYTDLSHHFKDKRLTLAATAVANTRYVKFAQDGGDITHRSFIENLRLTAKWRITDKDSLQVDFFQSFGNTKHRYHFATPYSMTDYDRNVGIVFNYIHDINDAGNSIVAETGVLYDNNQASLYKERNVNPYFVFEYNLPLFSQKAMVLLGTEHGYLNTWGDEVMRGQFLYDDLYVQFDYDHGPWLITLGDRYRHMNYWFKPYYPDVEKELWHHNRGSHSYVASVGYRFNEKNLLQGSFARKYFIPGFLGELVGDVDDQGKTVYNPDYNTNVAYVSELAYTYQKKKFLFMTSINNANYLDDVLYGHRRIFALRTSSTFSTGILRLTAGVNYYHQYTQGVVPGAGYYQNYYSIKLLPSLSLSPCTRLSATMIYVSKRDEPLNLMLQMPNMYASVRLSHYFSKRWNAFADFHDIAGQRMGNRALTVGATFNPI